MAGPSIDSSSRHRMNWNILRRRLSVGTAGSSNSAVPSDATCPVASEEPAPPTSAPRAIPRRVLGRHSTSEGSRPLSSSAPMPALVSPAATSESPPKYDDAAHLSPQPARGPDHASASPPPPPFEDDRSSLRHRRASTADLEPVDRPSFLANLAAVVDEDVGPEEELPSYHQDRFVHEGAVKLHVTTQGRLRPEVIILDKDGKLAFKPEVQAPPSSGTWLRAMCTLPLTTIIRDGAGVPALYLVQGPRVMDFEARSPANYGLIFRLAPNDLFNPGAHVRFTRNQRYVCLDVRRSIHGRWSIRAHPSGRIVGLVDKEPGMRRNMRITVAPGESSLLITAIALAMREPCYYDTRLPGPLMPFY